jgi:glycosyltransferase involved in cell wall biosynthesis
MVRWRETCLKKLIQKEKEAINDQEISMHKSNGILLLTDIFHGMGGSERNITQLLEGINKNKYRLYVARFASAHLAENMKDKDVAIMNLNGAGIYTISGLRNLALLKRFVSEKEISLILTYHESSDFYGLALSFICNIPVISSRRDMSFKTKTHHRLAYRLGGKYFNSVIAVSNAVRQEVIKRRWFREGKTFTIYNGINTANYENAHDGITLRKELGIHPKYPVVGMVANIRKIKGYHYFLEASSIIHRYNRNVQFLIIGNDWTEPGFTIAELKRYAEKTGVSQNLHFLGGREDVADLISLFDVAVLASLSEGFSNVILEYMASSRPIVATEVGGNPEIVVHGETGLLVPPADAQALADAILSILEDEEAALRYGAAAKKRVEDKFGLGKMIREYEDLFERVISTELSQKHSLFKKGWL